MKTIIIDDEPLALEVLEAYILKMPALELVGQFNNAIEATVFLKEHDVDLMFVDIQMPQFNGIDFVKSINSNAKIVFTTAYSEYAVESYELEVDDYLVKPISFDRFTKSVHKLSKPVDATLETSEDFIFVKADKKLVKINLSDIVFIEGLKDYVIINTVDRRVVTLQTMKSLEAKLSSILFKRIHRSYIVSIEKIIAIAANTIELKGLKEIKSLPIGKNYKQEIVDIINNKKL